MSKERLSNWSIAELVLLLPVHLFSKEPSFKILLSSRQFFTTWGKYTIVFHKLKVDKNPVKCLNETLLLFFTLCQLKNNPQRLQKKVRADSISLLHSAAFEEQRPFGLLTD